VDHERQLPAADRTWVREPPLTAGKRIGALSGLRGQAATELASFRHYPLPAPDFFVYLVGAAEIGGGLLLALGLFTRLAAVTLAGDMIGAITVSGVVRGEIISLTLAPLLLVTMIILIWSGGGSRSLDSWLAARLRRHGHALASRLRATDDSPGPARGRGR
jgi:uncharacterized membrane protein YphA (DoxX/SURF4 family)